MGFVNMISIWAFAAGNSGNTTAWLNEACHMKSVGLKGGKADAVYAHSMLRCYSTSFVGMEKNLILSTMIIKMLESYDAWHGTIMGDGQKERLTNDLQMAVARHQVYCMDYVPAGIFQDTALKPAKFTLQFWNALTAYIEDEYTLCCHSSSSPSTSFSCYQTRLCRFVTTCLSSGNVPLMSTYRIWWRWHYDMLG